MTKRNRIAILTVEGSLPGGTLSEGGIVRILELGSNREIVNDERFELPAHTNERKLETLFHSHPLDRVSLLWCEELTPRERLHLGDLGVWALRARAPFGRIVDVSRSYLAYPSERLGDFLVPVRIDIGDERWDVPAGIPLLLALEILGGWLDRSVLCFNDDCSRCEGVVRGRPQEAERRQRTCRLSCREGTAVSEIPDSCRWPGAGVVLPASDSAGRRHSR